MTLKEELESRVSDFAHDAWQITQGRVVPDTDSLTFGNTGTTIDACVLYADIHRSTAMVELLSASRSAELYKSFLYCAAKIVRSNGGTITAYDGDRIMAIYVGSEKADRAIKTAFQIHWAVRSVINPSFSFYEHPRYELKHTVGIDTGELLASKTGVRVDSDVVWVGSAANFASKLNSFDGLDITYPTRISEAVWQAASVDSTFSGGKAMWEQIDSNFIARVGVNYRRSSWFSSIA